MSKQNSTILIWENSSKNNSFGKITGNATIKGSGLNPKQLMLT
jgi:hypothetical protein